MNKEKLESLLGRRVVTIEPRGIGKLRVSFEDGSLWEVWGTLNFGGVSQVWDLQSAVEVTRD